MTDLTCQDLLQYLSDYINQELDAELTQAAKEHLSTCQHCRVVLDTTEKTILLFKTHCAKTIPADSRERLFSQLEDALLKNA